MNLSSVSIAAPAVCLAVLLSACGGGGGGGDSGTLRLALTDAPACGFEVRLSTAECTLRGCAESADYEPDDEDEDEDEGKDDDEDRDANSDADERGGGCMASLAGLKRMYGSRWVKYAEDHGIDLDTLITQLSNKLDQAQAGPDGM